MDWLNIFGLVTLICMLIPNAIYGIKVKNAVNRCDNRAVNVSEQVGRFASMFFMVFNIGIFEYGFMSDEMFALWFIADVALILLYWIFWIIFIFRRPMAVCVMLAVIPSIIFIGTGIMQRHIFQVASGILFAVFHIYITCINSRKA